MNFILLMDGYLGCFQYFNILSAAAMNVLVRVSCTPVHTVLVGIVLEMELLLGQNLLMLPNLRDNAKCFPK